MTTSTLQVPRRGPAGLRRPKKARRGLRTGSRADAGASCEPRRPVTAAASFCVYPLGAEGHLSSRTPGPPAWPNPEAPPCSWRPGPAVGLSLTRASRALHGKLGPAVRLLAPAHPSPASLPVGPCFFPGLRFPLLGQRPFIHSLDCAGWCWVAPPGCMTDPSSRCCQPCWAGKQKHAQASDLGLNDDSAAH